VSPSVFRQDLGESQPLRILVAEDNLVNQHVVLRLLERMGYGADIAANGLEVLDALERWTYDVVLLDVQMPAMDGLEAARRIKQRWPEQGPRLIGLTASAMLGDRETCFAAGMDGYLTKPIDVGALGAALAQCVRRNGAAAAVGRIPGGEATMRDSTKVTAA
jgi:CheY-like chemotaxis protein